MEITALRQQVNGLIETCESALKGRKKEDLPFVDTTTARVAIAILKEAKEKAPGDTILAAVTLPEPDKPMTLWSWTGILAAMNVVKAALPYPPQAQAGGRSGTYS
jgi:hypothetical protein